AVALPAPALAAPPLAILESHLYEGGAIPLDGVLTGLAGRDLLYGDSLAQAISARWSRPPGSSDPRLVDKYVALLERLNDRYIEGQFAEVVPELQRVIADLIANCALVVKQQLARDQMFRALVLLAHSQMRLGHAAAAEEAIAEAIRAFPERRVDSATYGIEVAQLYRRVLAAQEGKRRAPLRLETDHDAALFLDERFVGVGSAHVPDLPPGRYRALTQTQGRFGRVHEVQIDGEPVQLRIDAALDVALRTDGGAQLVFTTLTDRDANETRFAARVARELALPQVLLLAL